jgi:hypothetical protein
MKDISAALRMHVKEMPEQGSCLRVDLNNTFKVLKTVEKDCRRA